MISLPGVGIYLAAISLLSMTIKLASSFTGTGMTGWLHLMSAASFASAAALLGSLGPVLAATVVFFG